MPHTPEPILDPQRPIIDAHHHLWDRRPLQRGDSPFPEHGFTRMLQQYPRYLLDELLQDTSSGHRVLATVYVECRAMYRQGGPATLRCVGETEFANGVAAMAASGIYGPTQACAAIVAHADLRAGAVVEEVLQAHLAAGGGRLRGIRDSASWAPDPQVKGPSSSHAPEGLLLDAQFRQGFALLHGLGLVFEAWLFESQLPDLIDLARSHPETTIVLNHVGGPVGLGMYQGMREQRFDIWRDNIRALARCDNVVVKLGGLGMPYPGFDWSPERPATQSAELAQAWRPWIDTCIQAFGPQRCMFESNFPVDGYSCSYRLLWNAFKRLASGYTDTEQDQMFFGTAKRVYRIDVEP